MTTAFLVFALIAGVVSDDEAVRIFVFTQVNAEGFVDQPTKHRQDSVQDLRKALADKRGILVVDNEATADLRVEVLGRAYEPTGTKSTQVLPGAYGPQAKTSDDSIPVIRARLTAGTYVLDIDSGTVEAPFQSLRWQDKAKNLARQIEKWVKDNRSRLRPT